MEVKVDLIFYFEKNYFLLFLLWILKLFMLEVCYFLKKLELFLK